MDVILNLIVGQMKSLMVIRCSILVGFMKVGTLEEKIEEEFGIKVQIAGSDDSYLCKNNLTLASAQEKDQKKLGKKTNKSRVVKADSSIADKTTSPQKCPKAPWYSHGTPKEKL
jgi:hypothetical protein